MATDQRRRQGEFRNYEIWLQDMADPIKVGSTLDPKARYWEAKKAHYPTFEVVDEDSGDVFAFDVSRVYMVVQLASGNGTHRDRGHDNDQEDTDTGPGNA